jgi:dTDP-4-amino-4,6-dideoxygalactose transaminase
MERRKFIAAAAAAGTPALLAGTDKPALLGGRPAHTTGSPQWPKFDAREEKALLDVLRSGQWYRGTGKTVDAFEAAYAQLTGAKHCLATANGTSALITSLGALGVGPGDEVIVPPYTFVATINAVLMFGALPVFVDSDRETFQMDTRKLEPAISDHTVAIVPVHLGGAAADMDAVLAVARKLKLPVIEDACQSHLGEWKNRKVGTWGDTGCFSFQASKNLNSGEGGAVLTSDEELAEKCYMFHNNGRGRRLRGRDFTYSATGANLRMTEFQAALLMAQMTRLEEQSRRREQNAQYLSSLLREIKGLAPARMHDGCTRNAYHLYMFRYDPAGFKGLSRATLLKALRAEGIPASAGYSPLNKEPLILATLQSRGLSRVYSKQRVARWQERNRCPENDRLCEEAVWLPQNWLLGSREDMDHVAEAMRKVQAHAGDLLSA